VAIGRVIVLDSKPKSEPEERTCKSCGWKGDKRNLVYGNYENEVCKPTCPECGSTGIEDCPEERTAKSSETAVKEELTSFNFPRHPETSGIYRSASNDLSRTI
jgi:predicted RNA-binding Zn-ribbon protein involved in translation (DUF1610 family)